MAEIGAVIKIEAAQEILVGLTLSGMLGDDQARHDLKRLAGPQEGHGIHLRAADAHGAGGGGLQGSGAIGRSAGRDAAGACGDRLVRANGGSAPRTTILRRFWPSDPLGRRCVGSGDGHRRKLARLRRRPLLRRGGEHQNGRKSRGGKYPQQDLTHRHAPACLLLQFESD